MIKPERRQLNDTEFQLLRNYIQNISGICLDESKKNMMESRLYTVLEESGCNDYLELYNKASHDSKLSKSICSAISTNETSFFRDPHIFDMIADDFVPYFLNKSNKLRIWSAASSSGQESYSLSMLLHESIGDIDKYDIKIEGTDISNRAIAYASYGLFTRYEVSRGIDERRLYEHFDLVENGFRVKDNIRYITHFQELNLLKPIQLHEQFDIILCRNVAIYFDAPTKKYLFDTLAKYLTPNGRLVVGSSETLWQVTDTFHRQDYDGTVYYTLQKNPPQ